MSLSRRRFLGSVAAAGVSVGAASFAGCSKNRVVTGGIVGGPSKVGHLLRDGGIPNVTHEEKAQVVIVGGGIAGLSAARELQKAGINDFLLLELHNTCGGNSVSGSSTVTPYPWGAHYVPIATKESVLVQELFRDLGVITSPEGARPVYREEYLCAEPEERLFRLGRWSEGIVPSEPLTKREREEIVRLADLMEQFESKVGADGRKAFSLPLELSSRDRTFTDLDSTSFLSFLDQRGLASEPLRWYVDYCCRDDYGARASDTSAWAGIHYFASRTGWAANADPNEVVTWPEGNGWIVQRLAERAGNRIRQNALVFRVSEGNAPHVDYYDVTQRRSIRVRADAVVIAAPRFVASRLLGDADRVGRSVRMQYRPWVVANLTLDAPPDGPGAPLPAWDNVLYGSGSLGYVVATHQALRTTHGETVLTYYLPLSDSNPELERKAAHETSWATWRDRIVSDLERPHPSIRKYLKNVDVWIWGHGMISPSPGYLWNELRPKLAQPLGAVWFAHSDMSGLSLFEEAHYRGVEAARAVTGHLGGRA